MNQGIMPFPNPADSMFSGDRVLVDDQVIDAPGVIHVRFLGVPQNFTHLQIIYKCKGTATSTHYGALYMMLNQNSEAIYNWENIWAQWIYLSRDYYINQVYHIVNYASTAPAAALGIASGQILIPFYTDNKLMHRYITHTAYQNTIMTGSAGWEKLEAINDIQLFMNSGGGNYFVPGSRFMLYGVV